MVAASHGGRLRKRPGADLDQLLSDARLLTGARWAEARDAALGALQLPEGPEELLAGHAADLDQAWRAVGGGIVPDGPVSIDAEGRLHVAKDDARDTPPSLIDLRDRTGAMLAGVDLPEVILEVMAEYPAFAEAFTAVSGGTTRLADLHVSIAALLTAHALNVGLKPVLADLPALTRDRLAHVDQHYLRPENCAAANAVLIDAQAAIPLAQLWGGGLVAAVDGMRFVVPVRTLDGRADATAPCGVRPGHQRSALHGLLVIVRHQSIEARCPIRGCAVDG